jgi:uncharacterized protein
VYKTEIAAPSAARCLADLRWLLQSPPLLSLEPHRFSAAVQAFSAFESQHIAKWLDGLDPDILQGYVAQALPVKAPMRLGRYAERLMEFFLRESDLYQLVAANVPLRSALGSGTEKTHTTVGEFDYLVKDQQGLAWHWEMAVKFYLCHPTTSTAIPHDFKGPAGKDTLGLKLGKVFDKQLAHLPPTPYNDIAWQPAAVARGWMFYPHGAGLTPCDALNPEHLRGWWLGAVQFASANFESSCFVHLPRLHWLAPYSLNELPVLNQADMAAFLRQYWLTADIKQSQAGQMIACVTAVDGGWWETSRGFVMPNLTQNTQ